MRKKKILVACGYSSYGRGVEGLGHLVNDNAEFFANPKDFSLVLFAGGADVGPGLYGDISPKGFCHTNPSRDTQEKALFDCALENGIKMAGICRGVQILTALTGGRLIHHLDGHSGSHMMCTTMNDDIIQVNSIHHQMCIPSKGNLVVGWSAERLSKRYIGKADNEEAYNGPEVEAVLFPEIGALGVQYHPEMMNQGNPAYQFFWRGVEALLTRDMDYVLSMYTAALTTDKPLEKSIST